MVHHYLWTFSVAFHLCCIASPLCLFCFASPLLCISFASPFYRFSVAFHLHCIALLFYCVSVVLPLYCVSLWLDLYCVTDFFVFLMHPLHWRKILERSLINRKVYIPSVMSTSNIYPSTLQHSRRSSTSSLLTCQFCNKNPEKSEFKNKNFRCTFNIKM